LATTAAKEHRNQVIWGRIGPWIFFCVFTVFLFYELIFIAIEFDLKNNILFYNDISLSVFVLFRSFNQD
jgi:Na+/melibiose symporter-like transporter